MGAQGAIALDFQEQILFSTFLVAELIHSGVNNRRRQAWGSFELLCSRLDNSYQQWKEHIEFDNMAQFVTPDLNVSIHVPVFGTLFTLIEKHDLWYIKYIRLELYNSTFAFQQPNCF